MTHTITTIELTKEVMPQAEPDFLLGAALPAFMDLYREETGQVVTLAESRAAQYHQVGLAFGRRVEGHIEANPRLRLQGEFAADDIQHIPSLEKRFKAEACAQAGLSLLLDGSVGQWFGDASWITELTANTSSARGHLAVALGPDFADFMKSFFESKRWQQYRSGAYIAQLLHARFSSFPHSRLAFDGSAVADLAKVFDRQRQNLMAQGPDVLNDSRSGLVAEMAVFSK